MTEPRFLRGWQPSGAIAPLRVKECRCDHCHNVGQCVGFGDRFLSLAYLCRNCIRTIAAGMTRLADAWEQEETA